MDPRLKRTRMYLMLTITYGGIAFILAFLKQDIVMRFNVDPFIISMIAVSLGIAAVAPLLMLYLRGNLSIPILDRYFEVRQSSEPLSEPRIEMEQIVAELHDLRHQLALKQKTDHALTDADKAAMLQALRDQFAQTLADEYERRESTALAEKAGLLPIRRALESAGQRLREELGALSRRGNLNLVIGTLTTCAAVGLLIYMVLGHNAASASIPDLLAYYIPRISTVIFIEIFGFFFLRLYKTSLMELKYYQNELTTITLIGIAVEMASRQGSAESFTSLANTLVQCDRNHAVGVQNNSSDNNDHVLEKASSIIQELAKFIPKAG